MLKMLLLILAQCLLLSSAQVMLKFAMRLMLPFSLSWHFFSSLLTNWWFAASGISFAASGILWLYILRHYPLSIAYPLTSFSFIFGMIAATLFLHEPTNLTQWLGVLLVVAGSFLILR